MVHVDGVQIVEINDRALWRDWLAANHTSAKGVWLLTNKTATGKPRLSYAEAVEEALCFGWIDSKPSKYDEGRSMLYYSPRKPKSNWSALNKTRVAQLLAAGLMTPAGLNMVELAQRTGTWEALNPVDALIIPEDLQAELAKHPPADVHFAAFPKSAKQGILQWILNAKRPETRQNRILETATLAAQNKRANQYQKKQG